MKKKTLSEGKIIQNFLLHEMDYYVPSEGMEDESSLNHDYVGDVDPSFEEYPIDDSMESDMDYGFNTGSAVDSDDDLDMYDSDPLDYEDELDGDDSFLMDMENDIDYQDDEEEEFYDNELGGDIPEEDFFESKKRRIK